jgi:hypothetical protein
MNLKLYNFYLLWGKNNRARDDISPYAPWEVNHKCLKSIKYKHIKPLPKSKEKTWKIIGG